MINLSGDKPKTIAEAARVLKPGGRFAISDVIADPDMDEATKADMAEWTGCVAGALNVPSSGPCSKQPGLRRSRLTEPTRTRVRVLGDHSSPQAVSLLRAHSAGNVLRALRQSRLLRQRTASRRHVRLPAFHHSSLKLAPAGVLSRRG